MSAFIVHTEHIHTLVAAGLDADRWPLRWYYDNPTRIGELTPATATEVGQMLLDANIGSVDYRYSERNPRIDYVYRRPRVTGWSIGELLNALHCYEYQACEAPDWKTSQAHEFCRALERALIQQIPGYSVGPWAIDETSSPAVTTLRPV